MLKKLLIATAALGFSSTVLADPPHWAPAHGWRAKHHHRHHHHGYHAYAPRPVYVVPAPRVVYAAPPPPVLYYPAPVYHPAPVHPSGSVSIRLNLPL